MATAEKKTADIPANKKTEVQVVKPQGRGLHLDNSEGKTIISSEVIADIAGLAIREVPGVRELVPFGAGQTLTALATRITGNDQRDLGVSVEVGEIEAAIDCRIIVDYGVSVPEIADQIRASLKKRVKEMTGLVTKEVNIEIVDLYFEEAPKPTPAPPALPRVR